MTLTLTRGNTETLLKPAVRASFCFNGIWIIVNNIAQLLFYHMTCNFPSQLPRISVLLHLKRRRYTENFLTQIFNDNWYKNNIKHCNNLIINIMCMGESCSYVSYDKWWNVWFKWEFQLTAQSFSRYRNKKVKLAHTYTINTYLSTVVTWVASFATI